MTTGLDASRTGYAEAKHVIATSPHSPFDASRTGYAEAKDVTVHLQHLVIDASRTGYAEAKLELAQYLLHERRCKPHRLR